MSYKLRIVCPVFMLLMALIVFCFFGMSTLATSDEEDTVPSGAVTLTVETLPPSAIDEAYAEPLRNIEIAQSQSDDGYIETEGSGYVLTDSERLAVECAVMAEAGGEGERGQMMIAQCILDGSLRNDISPIMMIYEYQVVSAAPCNVTDEVRESVSKVFDDGLRVTEEKADLWYNPAIVESSWHEGQEYVATIGYHRFFWCSDNLY